MLVSVTLKSKKCYIWQNLDKDSGLALSRIKIFCANHILYIAALLTIFIIIQTKSFDVRFIIFLIWKVVFMLLSWKLFRIPCWHQRNVGWLSTFLDTTSTVWNVKMHLETMNTTKKTWIRQCKKSFQQIVIYLWLCWNNL